MTLFLHPSPPQSRSTDTKPSNPPLRHPPIKQPTSHRVVLSRRQKRKFNKFQVPAHYPGIRYARRPCILVLARKFPISVAVVMKRMPFLVLCSTSYATHPGLSRTMCGYATAVRLGRRHAPLLNPSGVPDFDRFMNNLQKTYLAPAVRSGF